MQLASSAFTDGTEIPRRHGYKMENVSPPLSIRGVPDSAVSLALVMDDPDAMGAVGKVWVHWLVWNIDPGTSLIPENSHAGGTEGETDFGEIGYGGPAPPDKSHTYIFKLYALDDVLDLGRDVRKHDLERAMAGHIVGEAALTGTYAP